MDVVLLSEGSLFFSLLSFSLSLSSFFSLLILLLFFSFVTRLLLPFFGLFFPLSWAGVGLGGATSFFFLCQWGVWGIHGREEYSSLDIYPHCVVVCWKE